jgi:molecular chaperone GrpE (heat shock protein)
VSLLSRFLGRKQEQPNDEGPLAEQLERRQLMETVQKLARSQAKLALRVEELDGKIEGGFADLGNRLDDLALPASADDTDWGELLDAVDLLCEAVHQAGPGSPLAEGLTGVRARLERFLAQQGIERLTAEGQSPDGRLFRVVGSQPSPVLAEGVVTRVVRAAAVRGQQVLREGEVIVAGRSA